MVTMERRTDGSALRNTRNQFFYHLTVVFIVDVMERKQAQTFLACTRLACISGSEK